MTPDESAQAACAGHQGDMFFPEYGGGLVNHFVAEAKALCMKCPVKLSCLEEALRIPTIEGIWGGTTKSERSRMRRLAAV